MVGSSSVWLYIGIFNSGDTPISIDKVGLELGTRLKHHPLEVDKPNPYKEVTKGELYKVPVIDVDVDERQLLWAWAKDASGKQYKSKVHPYIKAD